MKVVIATPLYPPESGGPATYSKLLEDGLPLCGIEVGLVKFSEVRHLPKFVRHVAYFFRVLRAARKADLVYALDAVSVGLPTLLAAKMARKPFVVKVVGDYAWEQGRQRYGVDTTLDEFVRTRNIPFALSIFRSIQTRVAAKASRIVVPSSYLKTVVEAWGINAMNVRVVQNAVTFDPSDAVPEQVARLPRPLVVSVGRLVPWKGFDEVIGSLVLLRARGMQVSLAIAGDGPERLRLETKARETLREGFAFTGLLSHADTCALIARADVFVLDSLYEGLSHTLVEAFAAGVPIIASDVGGNREIVRNEDNGLLVPPEDTKALSAALARILSDDTLRARLLKGSKTAAALFSVDTMLEKTASCLCEAVKI